MFHKYIELQDQIKSALNNPIYNNMNYETSYKIMFCFEKWARDRNIEYILQTHRTH